MTSTKKSIFIFFILAYLIIGLIYSLNTGISHDEFHEQQNWEYNVAIVKNFFFNEELDLAFQNFEDKYYGIGFHLVSQPVQFLLSDIILSYQDIDSQGAHLVSKHAVTFLFFLASGVFVYLIFISIINNKFFAAISTSLYLLYPYLLGHSFFNPKDIPFLSIWVICSYVSLNIFDKLLEGKNLTYLNILLLSFFTGYLLSIRISGVLIFIQYFITLLIYLNLNKKNILFSLKDILKKIIFFILTFILFTYLLYPIFWKEPLLIITTISYMSNYFNDVCTLTLGKCMEAKNLDPTYIPIWLMVKLPLIVLTGLLLLPFSENKIFVNKKKIIFFGTLLATSFLIPIILIIKKIHLYDELRQILFLVPLIFITGIISIYVFSKKIFYFLSIVTLCLFIIENIKIYPYQYVWFNSPSRVLDISSNFELDYWGLSGKELAKQVTILQKKEKTKPCVLVSPVWTAKHFLDSRIFNCYGDWAEIDSSFPRPFWGIQNVRNLKKGDVYKCKSIYQSKFNLIFVKEDFVTGRLIKCI